MNTGVGVQRFLKFRKDISLFEELNDDIIQNFLYLIFHLWLSKPRYASNTLEAVILNEIIDKVVSWHVRQVIINKLIIWLPLAAALFEQLIKALIDESGPLEVREELKDGICWGN
ncbi:MAG: hypothetical protein J7K23_03740 [Thermoproteales archaeon]|nr:hypothetical protein [Thermoproteales archaeon]